MLLFFRDGIARKSRSNNSTNPGEKEGEDLLVVAPENLKSGRNRQTVAGYRSVVERRLNSPKTLILRRVDEYKAEETVEGRTM